MDWHFCINYLLLIHFDYIKYTITAATNLLLLFLLLLFLWWPVRKENEVTLRQAEMRIVRWMCDVKVKEFQVKR